MVSFSDFFPSGVKTLISDRSIDFTLVPGFQGLSAVQAQYLTQNLSNPIKNIVNIRQVHGSRVLEVTEADLHLQKIIEADAVVTSRKRVPVAVRTADCLPIFIYDPQQDCIGLVHAGWKGTREGVVKNTLKMMRERFSTRNSDLLIAFGPSIRECCYQVGREFLEYFPQSILIKNEKFYLDLCLENRNQLREEGVPSGNIRDCGICTVENTGCYSYRREGDQSGRMLSVMLMV